ncbi:hypothetical protein FAZ69_22035 [Trinickia terrae]|uniref:Uncharacterized protein n=1 Tax=Trinickia terrae TaxID=2571161 RepID=A0A4U1HYG7_9BURK|nr:hypothetical protein [Trinickia terrae]TKC85993.1 hypothetical protein FAZ69_22035 [Trinickia terrae]
MSRAELIEYARGLDVALARLSAQHANPLGRAVRLARASAHHRELGVTTMFDAYGLQAGGYDSAFHVVFEMAEQAMRRAEADRQVERQLARLHPKAAAALIALRRHALRDTLDWPLAARLDYERNLVAEALVLVPSHVARERMDYWASLLDMFPRHEFDVVAKAPEYTVDDGATALEEGVKAGLGDDLSAHQDNRYAPGTFRYAKWIQGYRRGRRKATTARRGPRARPDGAGDVGS